MRDPHFRRADLVNRRQRLVPVGVVERSPKQLDAALLSALLTRVQPRASGPIARARAVDRSADTDSAPRFLPSARLRRSSLRRDGQPEAAERAADTSDGDLAHTVVVTPADEHRLGPARSELVPRELEVGRKVEAHEHVEARPIWDHPESVNLGLARQVDGVGLRPTQAEAPSWGRRGRARPAEPRPRQGRRHRPEPQVAQPWKQFGVVDPSGRALVVAQSRIIPPRSLQNCKVTGNVEKLAFRAKYQQL